MGIIEDIRAAFTSNIEEVKWMDAETREAAKRKVKRVQTLFCFSQLWSF